MLKRYLPFFIFMFIIACSKDKLQTKPSIKIKSLNSEAIPPGGELNITLEFTDKEGDLSKGELTYVRDRTNLIPAPPLNDIADTIRTTLGDFPKALEGEIQIKVSYNFMKEDPGLDVNDTMIFRIVVKDIAGNISDTIASPKVVALHP